jgi:hypothetical protein
MLMIRSVEGREGRRRRRARWWAVAATGLLAAVCFGQGIGDTLYVERQSVPIRDGKRAYNKVLATAVQGQGLTITGIEGDWLKVRYGSGAQAVDGYVYSESLSARQVTASAAGTGASAHATGVGASASAKGLLNADKYAKEKGLDRDPFYKMVLDSHASVKDADFDKFTTEGKLGPKKASAGGTTSPSTAPSIQ